MASFHSQTGVGPNKITKTRGKTMKPILKKLSHSEKNSLDLDRGWEEQQWAGVYGSSGADYARSAKDVSFAFEGGSGSLGEGASVGAGAGAGVGVGGESRRKFQHMRQSSASSSFIHPFQQVPRTATPPLTYTNSNNSKDYSPAITEAEDGEGDSRSYPPKQTPTQTSNSQFFVPQHNRHPSSLSQTSLRRPSFASQRTASFSDIASSATPQLRINTAARQGSQSRLAPGSLNKSQSDLQRDLSTSGVESPTGSFGGPFSVTAGSITSPASSASVAPMSPLRSSLEGFRLRSRSDMDTGSRADNIRIARRKFEERERAKAEKHDREMIRKRERKDTKEASRIEKEAAQLRKNSFGNASPDPELVRPAAVRMHTGTKLSSSAPMSGAGLSGTRVNSNSASTSRNDVSSSSILGGRGSSTYRVGSGSRRMTNEMAGEKQISFLSRDYDSVPGQTPPAFGPGVEDVRFQQARPRKASATKKKTLGAWHGFLLWLRTKLLRLGGR